MIQEERTISAFFLLKETMENKDMRKIMESFKHFL